MRRPFKLRSSRSALAAVYDALLFLMVAILISAGMFLYSATSVSDGGDFAESMHQRRCDNQLIMIENLAVNQTDPEDPTSLEEWSVQTPVIRWTNGTNVTDTFLTDMILMPKPVETVGWLLRSYCLLTWLNEHGEANANRMYNTSVLLDVVNGFFEENKLNGTEHAWRFRYEGEEQLFGSSTLDRVEDLPADRWASSRDYSDNTTVGKSFRITTDFSDNKTVEYSAMLWYYMWFP